MNYLIPQKKLSSWRLTQAFYPDGSTETLSGYNGDGFFSSHRRRQWEENARAKGAEIIDDAPNFVFYAHIKPTGYSRGRSSAIMEFDDKDGVHKFHAGMDGTFKILTALGSGKLKFVDDGYIFGVFTFVKQGTSIYIIPYED